MNTGRVVCHASLRLFGGSGSLRNASSRPTSRRLSASSPGRPPIARATRCGVPKRLPRTAIVPPPGAGNEPFGRSNRSAGPARLEHAIAELRHLEARVDLDPHAFQLALRLELCNEVAKVAVRHQHTAPAPPSIGHDRAGDVARAVRGEEQCPLARPPRVSRAVPSVSAHAYARAMRRPQGRSSSTRRRDPPRRARSSSARG